MHIKPPTSATVGTTPQPAKTASTAGKGNDFAQMLKTAQAETPAAGPMATSATNPAISPTQGQA